MHTSLLMAAALVGSFASPPVLAQERSVSPSTTAPASGSADTGRRADMPPKTTDGTKNRNAGAIETDEGRVAGDSDANDARDKAHISDEAINEAVEDASKNASTPTAVGGTKPAQAPQTAPQVTQGSAGKGTGSQTLDTDQSTSAGSVGSGGVPTRKGVPDGRVPSPTESRPALTPRSN